MRQNTLTGAQDEGSALPWRPGVLGYPEGEENFCQPALPFVTDRGVACGYIVPGGMPGTWKKKAEPDEGKVYSIA